MVQKVFDKVEDIGQERLSTTWVITTKISEGKEITKARLVARGYEEDSSNIRSDSPTCQKANVRMLLAIAVAKQWTVRSLDIKAAFLQGKEIERELCLQPPKEFREKGVIWKLKKVVYGLCDASRNWYLKVLEVLESLGMKVSKWDKAVFTYKKEEIEGIVLIHVDDLLFFGSSEFYLEVMSQFKNIFMISREDKQAFKYLGIVLTQNKDGTIILDQKSFLDSMEVDLLQKEDMKDKERTANKEEIRLFRQGVGKLGWITSITKPEAALSFCILSTKQSQPIISDFIKFRKAVKDLKTGEAWIKIPKLNLQHLQVIVFSDASFGNLPNGASQLGYIIFVGDEYGNVAPISWISKKARRIARSTLTAETLAAVDAVDMAMMISSCLEDLLNRSLPPVRLYTDNKSLYDSARTTNLLEDKRLQIEMNALREMIDNHQIQIEWVSTSNQIADVLTKLGADKKKLTDVLSSGVLQF